VTVCLQSRQCRRAGSDVATTCSYQASFAGFERAGVGRGDAEALLRRSVRLADSARQRFWAEHSEALADADDARADAHADAAGGGGALANGGPVGEGQCNGEPGGGAGREGGGARPGSESGSAQGLAGWQWARGRPLVAFSLGSYGAALADGSEFTGAYGARVTEAQLMAFHRERIQARAAPGRARAQAQRAAPGGCPASPAARVRSVHSAPGLLALPRALRQARAPGSRVRMPARAAARAGAGAAASTGRAARARQAGGGARAGRRARARRGRAGVRDGAVRGGGARDSAPAAHRGRRGPPAGLGVVRVPRRGRNRRRRQPGGRVPAGRSGRAGGGRVRRQLHRAAPGRAAAAGACSMSYAYNRKHNVIVLGPNLMRNCEPLTWLKRSAWLRCPGCAPRCGASASEP